MAEFILGNPLRKLAREHPLLQRVLWRLDFVMVWLLVKLFTLLPVDVASRFGERVGGWIGPRLNRKSMIYKENLALAFPELDSAELDDLVRAAWARAGRVLAEYPHLARIVREPDRLVIDIREQTETYRNPSRACVFVTAHQSNWEIAGLALSKLGIPSASLYSPPTNPYLDRMLRRSREALRNELVPRDNSTRMLRRALKSGRSTGIVMDRRVDGGKPIRFFGRDKLSTILPAWLALKQGCDMVPVKVERLRDARYRATFYPPVRPGDPGADLTQQAIDMTQQAHDLFETWARENPRDWFCSKRLWPKSDTGRQRPSSDAEGERHAA